MRLTKKKLILIHTFIWLFAICANLPFSGIVEGMPARQIVSYAIGFLYLMVVFYLFYLFITPLFLNRKQLAAFFAVSFLSVLVLPFFGYLLLYLSRALFDGTFTHFFSGYSVRTHLSGFYPVVTAALFGSFFRVIINWFETMNQKAESDSQRLGMELDLLKSKLNPHFLFNTLNNIDSLIRKNPDEASSALIRLSDIMRYLTYETRADTVPLHRETEYIRNLIELNRIRIKSPDDIRFSAEGNLDLMVSPAIFIPLIENAFKFASYRNGKPAIDIHLFSNGGIIRFEITNYCEPRSSADGTGHSGLGISNIRKRLDLSYPGKHNLEITDKGHLFSVSLTIDTNAD
jgi:two-component system, LytTR family, sensor kinase